MNSFSLFPKIIKEVGYVTRLSMEYAIGFLILNDDIYLFSYSYIKANRTNQKKNLDVINITKFIIINAGK